MEEILNSYTVVIGPMSQFTVHMSQDKFSVKDITPPEVGFTYNLLLLISLLRCDLNPDYPKHLLQRDTNSLNWKKFYHLLVKVEKSISDTLEEDEPLTNYEFFMISEETKLPPDGRSSELCGWLIQVIHDDN